MFAKLIETIRRPFVVSARVVRAAAVAALLAAVPTLVYAQACEDPRVLRFSIIPTQESIRELTLYKPVLDQISKATGKRLEFYMPTSYASVVEALLGKWVDVAVLGPESYLIARSKGAQIDVFATYFKKRDGIQEAGPGFKSILITKKGSKYSSIEATKGSVMLLVDPASTSGALIPESVFSKVVKMPLKQYFSRVAFSGGHDLSTIAIADGKADAAFVATHRFMNTVKSGKVKIDDFNILWSSPLIPQDPFVFRSTLCPELKNKIVQVFLDLDKNPDGKKYLDNVDAERFVAMKDSDYDVVREAGGGK